MRNIWATVNMQLTSMDLNAAFSGFNKTIAGR